MFECKVFLEDTGSIKGEIIDSTLAIIAPGAECTCYIVFYDGNRTKRFFRRKTNEVFYYGGINFVEYDRYRNN